MGVCSWSDRTAFSEYNGKRRNSKINFSRKHSRKRGAEKSSKYATTFLQEQGACTIYFPTSVLHKVELYPWFILHAFIPPVLQILFKRYRSKEKKLLKSVNSKFLLERQDSHVKPLSVPGLSSNGAGPKDEQEERA